MLQIAKRQYKNKNKFERKSFKIFKITNYIITSKLLCVLSAVRRPVRSSVTLDQAKILPPL